MTLKFSVLDMQVKIDLDRDFDKVPVEDAHLMPSARQVQVIKYLLAKGVLNQDSVLSLAVQEVYNAKGILFPDVHFSVNLEKGFQKYEGPEDDLIRRGMEGMSSMNVIIDGDGNTQMDHYYLVYTCRWSRNIGEVLDYMFKELNNRFGSITYDPHS